MELGLWVRSSGCPVTRPDLALNLRFELVARDLQVIVLLHAEPELGRCTKVARQPERRLSRDAAPAFNNLRDAIGRGTCSFSASLFMLMPSGLRNSSSRISPG
jgi:hypothetical protein